MCSTDGPGGPPKWWERFSSTILLTAALSYIFEGFGHWVGIPGGVAPGVLSGLRPLPPGANADRRDPGTIPPFWGEGGSVHPHHALPVTIRAVSGPSDDRRVFLLGDQLLGSRSCGATNTFMRDLIWLNCNCMNFLSPRRLLLCGGSVIAFIAG